MEKREAANQRAVKMIELVQFDPVDYGYNFTFRDWHLLFFKY